MPDEIRHRGAKPLSDKDWLFGSRPRRKLLEGVLLGEAPESGWTRPELARLAGVVANGGVDEHVAGLRRLGMLVVDDTRRRTWHPVVPRPPLGEATRRLLVELSATSGAIQAPRQSKRAPMRTATQAMRAAERAVQAARHELGVEMADELVRLLGRARSRLTEGSD